jgi:hypothetical protein
LQAGHQASKKRSLAISSSLNLTPVASKQAKKLQNFHIIPKPSDSPVNTKKHETTKHDPRISLAFWVIKTQTK